jgi:formylglycine-generating enzyme required for sulfatase activity
MRLRAAAVLLLVASCAQTTPKEETTAVASLAPTSPPASTAAPSAAPPEPAPTTTAPAGPLPPPEGMALVPAGAFTMGADRGGEEDEHPAHRVELAAFYLDLTEVTNGAYGRCVDASICPAPDPKNASRNNVGPDSRFRGAQQPVSSVSWDSAKAYCGWMGKRLPTEAEWEKAARGDDARTYPWGRESPTAARAVFASRVTQDVGTHPTGDGPYGHHDLAGNVWEWVEDVYDPYAYRRPEAAKGGLPSCEQALEALAELRAQHRQGFTGTNPIPTECERVLRGGAFNYDGPGLRSSNRVHHPGRFKLVMSGFRCAKDAP